jgi:DNA-binding XRE family transcriptional regulator
MRRCEIIIRRFGKRNRRGCLKRTNGLPRVIELTQAALAERLGVDRSYVGGLELGQRNPTVVTPWHITKALGVKLESFFDEEKTRRKVR